MSMGDDGSITHWIRQLKTGESTQAQEELWNRYFERLVAIARTRLRGSPNRTEDEEDAALSALDSFFLGVDHGRFPDLRDRSQLWPLLLTITATKVLNQVQRERTLKRGGGQLQSADDEEHLLAIEKIIGIEPTPEMAAEAAEECQHLLDSLESDSLRKVAQMKLEGYTNREIAASLDVVERTIERKLWQIRRRWSASCNASSLFVRDEIAER